jgi:hypothetical protein
MGDKKKFRDIHGETRVGKFLRSIKKSGLVGRAIDSAGSLASGDVLGALKTLLVEDTSMSAEDKAFALEELRLDIERERSITRRWTSDLKYGNILTKSIRPVILLILTLSFVVGFFLGTYDMNIIGDLLTIVLSGYFVMRSGDKIFGKER